MSTSLFIKYLHANKLLEFPFCFGGRGGPPLNVINIRNAKEQRN